MARADARDADELQACLEACSAYFREAEGRDVRRSEAADLLGEVAANPSRRVFVVRGDGEESLGVLDVALAHPSKREATVAFLALRPSARRRGLGKEIVARLFASLRRRGFRRVRLGVRRGARGAADFWTALGFEETRPEGGVRQFAREL